jgi:uncharacterized protein YkwD
MFFRSKALPAAAAAVALLAMPTAASAAAKKCAGGNIVPSQNNVVAVRHATLCLLNQQRHAHGLRRLRSSAKLRSAAQSYSWSMVRNDFFDHVSPGGSTLMTRVRSTAYLASSRGWALGENIAWGADYRATPKAIVSAWMHSSGHRHNILTGRFSEIGIGVAPGAPVALPAGMSAATYTTDFGTRG